MSEGKKTFYGYVRVSTMDQADNGASLLAQEELIVNEYARKYRDEGYEAIRIFREEGVSAFKNNLPDRPEGAVMLNKVGRGDLVMFTRMDRAFRNVEDGRRTLAFLQQAGARCIILDYMGGGQVDTDTAAGKFVVTVMLSVSELESGIKSERLKAVDDYNRKTRGWARTVHSGFKTVLRNGKTVAIPDPDLIRECEVVMRAWFKEGYDAAVKLVGGKYKLQSRAKGTKHFGISMGSTDYDKSNAMQRAWKKLVSSLANTGRLGPLLDELGVPVWQVIDEAGIRTRSPVGVHQNLTLSDEGRKHVGLIWKKQASTVPVRDSGRHLSRGPVREVEPFAQLLAGQDHLLGQPVPCVAGSSASRGEEAGEGDGSVESGADHSLDAAGHGGELSHSAV